MYAYTQSDGPHAEAPASLCDDTRERIKQGKQE